MFINSFQYFIAMEEIGNCSHWKDVFLPSLVIYEIFKTTKTVTRKSPPAMQTPSFRCFSISKVLQTMWICRKYDKNKSHNLTLSFHFWTVNYLYYW